MTRLGVNIDHIATLRNVRGGLEPDPVFAAFICQTAGADSIVAHLREDQRHIKERDLYILKQTVKAGLNLEMSLGQDIVNIACKVKPDRATLVPEKRKEITTEGGLDVAANVKRVAEVFHRLRREGIALSLFIDPEKKQIDAAKKIGTPIIELHTGRYANAKSAKDRDICLKDMVSAVNYAKAKGLSVAAGHGLDYYNVSAIAGIKGLVDLNFGFCIVCRAALVGLERAVKEMLHLIAKTK